MTMETMEFLYRELNNTVISLAFTCIGKKDWSLFVKRISHNNEVVYNENEPKDELFIYELFTKAGYELPLKNEAGILGKFNGNKYIKRPYTVKQWYLGEVPNTELIGYGDFGIKNSHPGYIITDGVHIGIITRPQNCVRVSPLTNKIVEDDWGWKENNSNFKIFSYSTGENVKNLVDFDFNLSSSCELNNKSDIESNSLNKHLNHNDINENFKSLYNNDNNDNSNLQYSILSSEIDRIKKTDESEASCINFFEAVAECKFKEVNNLLNIEERINKKISTKKIFSDGMTIIDYLCYMKKYDESNFQYILENNLKSEYINDYVISTLIKDSRIDLLKEIFKNYTINIKNEYYIKSYIRRNYDMVKLLIENDSISDNSDPFKILLKKVIKDLENKNIKNNNISKKLEFPLIMIIENYYNSDFKGVRNLLKHIKSIEDDDYDDYELLLILYEALNYFAIHKPSQPIIKIENKYYIKAYIKRNYDMIQILLENDYISKSSDPFKILLKKIVNNLKRENIKSVNNSKKFEFPLISIIENYYDSDFERVDDLINHIKADDYYNNLILDEALYFAIKNQSLPVIKYLFDKGANIYNLNYYINENNIKIDVDELYSIIKILFFENKYDILDCIFEDELDKKYQNSGTKLDINFQNSNNETLLDFAIKHDNYYAINFLLEKDASINYNINLFNILVYIIFNDKLNLLKKFKFKNFQKSDSVLNDDCLDINIKDKNGWTMLFYSIYYEKESITKYLIENGINISERDISKNTPLSIAITTGNINIINFLLNSINITDTINSRNNEGETPLTSAIKKFGNRMEYDKTLTLLISKANVNFKDEEGIFLLVHAYQQQSYFVINKLLESGINKEQLNQFFNKNRKKISEKVNKLNKSNELIKILEEYSEIKKILKLNGIEIPINKKKISKTNSNFRNYNSKNEHENQIKRLSNVSPKNDKYEDTIKTIKKFIKKKNFRKVNDLIKKEENENGNTFFHYLINHGHIKFANKLLNNENININLKVNNIEKETLLIMAIKKYCILENEENNWNDWNEMNKNIYKKFLQNLIKKKKSYVNLKDENNFSPLMYALQQKSEFLFNELLKHGADIQSLINNKKVSIFTHNYIFYWNEVKDSIKKAKNSNNNTLLDSLLLNISKSRYTYEKYLKYKNAIYDSMELKVEFNIKNLTFDMIYRIIWDNEIEALKYLLEKDKKTVLEMSHDKMKWTPVLLAVCLGQPIILDLLLSKGGNIDQKDLYGRNVYWNNKNFNEHYDNPYDKYDEINYILLKYDNSLKKTRNSKLKYNNKPIGTIKEIESKINEIKNSLIKNNIYELPDIYFLNHGTLIKSLQELLILKGYECGLSGSNGYYNRDTYLSIRRFQRDNHLNSHGIVDTNTWKLLLSL